MATRDTGQPANGISRRAFLTSAAVATAAVGCGFDVAYDAEKALAYESQPTKYQITTTTCPYCSASCGQRVVKALDGDNAGKVIDIYGDFESPMNSGGLCAKGAGSMQLVTNKYRVGAYSATHPVDAAFASRAETGDGLGGAADFSSGVAYKRTGNGSWSQVGLSYAMNDIAAKMVTARAQDTTGWAAGNSKSVAFFGSSHMNNEPNYVYRKLIANFGTSNTEHQARI
jgi:formate dehydrogenase major subunit